MAGIAAGRDVGCVRGQNLAGAVEAAARLDDQIDDMHVALDAAAGDDFQTARRYGTVHVAADHHGFGLNLAVHVPVLADHHAGFGFDVAVDPAVDVQRVLQGEIADKLAVCRDDGRSNTRTLLRTVLAKDCHWTLSSCSKTVW